MLGFAEVAALITVVGTAIYGLGLIGTFPYSAFFL